MRGEVEVCLNSSGQHGGGFKDRRSCEKLQKCDSRTALQSPVVHGEDTTAARGVIAGLLRASTRRIKMVGRLHGSAAFALIYFFYYFFF